MKKYDGDFWGISYFLWIRKGDRVTHYYYGEGVVVIPLPHQLVEVAFGNKLQRVGVDCLTFFKGIEVRIANEVDEIVASFLINDGEWLE